MCLLAEMVLGLGKPRVLGEPAPRRLERIGPAERGGISSRRIQGIAISAIWRAGRGMVPQESDPDGRSTASATAAP